MPGYPQTQSSICLYISCAGLKWYAPNTRVRQSLVIMIFSSITMVRVDIIVLFLIWVNMPWIFPALRMMSVADFCKFPFSCWSMWTISLVSPGDFNEGTLDVIKGLFYILWDDHVSLLLALILFWFVLLLVFGLCGVLQLLTNIYWTIPESLGWGQHVYSR